MVLVIRVLGELELELDGRRAEPPARSSGRLLLGYLALNRGFHSRADLAALLWPDVLDESARASLRSAVASIRRALGEDADRYLMASGHALGLAGDLSVDVERFEELIGRGDLDAALALSRGQLLQGLDADWVRQARAEQVAREGDLLATLAREAEAAGSLDAAIRYARRRVALAPLAEPPNRELIRLLAAAGDRASALAVYSELAERFRRELKAVPSAQTRRLADAARTAVADATGGREMLPLPEALTVALKDPFVNRSSERELLAKALSGAAAGAGAVALLAGEAGIGKSALVARFAAESAPTARVLLGRCGQGAAAPFEPFVEAIRHYVVRAPDEALERDLPPAASELGALIPELAEWLIAPPLPQDLLDDGARIGRALVDVLMAICRIRPLLLVVEDVHEAEANVFDVLEQLMRRCEGARLMLVVTVRSNEVGRLPRLQKLTRRVRALPGGTYIALEGLDAASVRELAKVEQGDHLSDEQVHSLVSRTGGNPLFVAQLLARADALDDWPLPERVQDAVADELARLRADAQRALVAASALGVEFDLGTLRAVSGCSEELLLDLLDEAIGVGVIRELPSSVGRYAFRHELIRDGIYEGMTATRRAYLHKRVAETLRTAAVEGDGTARAALEHLRRADDLVPRAELVEGLVAAAREAEAQRTHRDARDLYREAVDLLPPSTEQRCELLIALGHAQRRAGHGEAAPRAFVRAGEAAAELDRSDLVISAALGLCALPFFAGDAPSGADVIALLELALGTLDEARASERARLLARLAAEQHYGSAPDQLARRAVELARGAGQPVALAAALDVAHLAFRADSRGRLELARSLVNAVEERDQPELLVPAVVHQTIAQVELGELDALERNAQVLSDLAAEFGQPAYAWWALLWRATAQIARGDLVRGEALAGMAYATGRTAFGPAAELELQAQRAWLLVEREQVDELAGALGQLEDAFPALPVWSALRARILAQTGRPDDAGRVVGDLTRGGFGRLERDTNWLVSAWLLAETFAHTARQEQAADLRAALEPRAEQWAVSARGTVCLGPIAGALALLCATEGDIEQAERYRRIALERCAAADAQTAAARIGREYQLSRSAVA